MYDYEHKDGQDYHQVGVIYAHFYGDLMNMIDALKEKGYSVCHRLDGDVLIMKQGGFDNEEIDEIEDDLTTDDDDGRDDTDGNNGIIHFPKEY